MVERPNLRIACASCALLVACADDGYTVRVSFSPPELTNSAEVVELALVSDCTAQGGSESEPTLVVGERVVLRRGQPLATLGDLPVGRFGLWGRATAGDCRIVAHGCAPVRIDAGGNDELHVELVGVEDGTLCPPETTCSEGRCMPNLPTEAAIVPIECEAGRFVGALRAQDERISGGQSVRADTGASSFVWSQDAPALPPDRVEIPITLSHAGSYHLWVRLSAETAGASGLYVGLSEQAFRRVELPATYGGDGAWAWVGSSSAAPVVLEASDAGAQTLYVGLGDPSAACDALVLATIETARPTGEHEVVRATAAPVIDGVLSEYEGAATLQVGVSRTSTRATHRMLWDDTALYVATRVIDTDVNAEVTATDGEVWLDDSIELMFDPSRDRGLEMNPGDYKLSVNAAGTWRDIEGSGGGGMDVAWTSGVELQVRATATGYDVEARVPWAAFPGPPGPGTRWGFDICHNDFASGGTRSQACWWNADGDHVNSPNGWGQLVFAAP